MHAETTNEGLQVRTPRVLLARLASVWFLVAIVGQWLFLIYVASYYGGFFVDDGLKGLAESHLPKSYIPGDLLGNLAIAAHLFLAVAILGTGPLQFVSSIRSRFPHVHHWNGRAYVSAALIATCSGLYMVWIRGSVGDLSMHLGLSLNAVFVFVAAFMTILFATRRQIMPHYRWALRLFIVVSGVWFARVFMWLWVFLTGGVGINWEHFTGPFLTFNNYAQFLLPLGILELYFVASARNITSLKLAMSMLLLVLTVLMGVGIYQAAVIIWLPKL